MIINSTNYQIAKLNYFSNDMRVLWLSNIQLLSKKNDKSGTWIHSMYRELLNHDDVEIVGNITVANATKRIEKMESMNFTEYLIPKAFINSQGLPKPSARLKLLDLIKSFNADIVHVWGIEQFWGSLIPIRGGISLKYKVLSPYVRERFISMAV